MIVQTLLSIFLYPGLALTLALSLLYTMLVDGPLQTGTFVRDITNPAPWRHAEGLFNLLSIILAAIGLAFLPWPMHLAPAPHAGIWLIVWGGLEAAFFVALIPSVLAGTPHIVRAAMREAQIGVMGRIFLWLGLFTSILSYPHWAVITSSGYSPLLLHILSIGAVCFAFPVAVGWGPCSAETSVTLGGTDQGLDKDVLRFKQRSHTIRTVALLTASLVALLPMAVLNPLMGLPLFLICFGIVCTILKKLNGTFPRLSLPDILQRCWWRSFPSSMAALIYLAIGS